jgi:hypothetical protein
MCSQPQLARAEASRISLADAIRNTTPISTTVEPVSR